MLNRYPLWKNLLILFVVLFGTLYALPNLFGEDYAVQISGTRGGEVTVDTVAQVERSLERAGIPIRGLTFENGQMLVRVDSDEDQLNARELLVQELGSQYVVALNLAPATPAWLAAIGGEPLKLGLDLRGGVHFLMEVDMEEALSKIREQMVTTVQDRLREERLRYQRVQADGNSIVVTMRNEADFQSAIGVLRNQYQGYDFRTDSSSRTITLAMTDQFLQETRSNAIDQNITILRNRVDELGVAEPLIQRQGADRIVVELPGVQDTARAKEILGATATLEFRFVDTDNDVQDAIAGRVPFGSRLFDQRGGGQVLLENRVILTGDHIVNASVGYDESNRPQVNISLDSAGGRMMTQATRGNIGKPMATVFIEFLATGETTDEGRIAFDRVEEVVSVATIQAVLGSNFRITGVGSVQDAQNLALLLRAGALIAPIQIVEERTVGPSLGAENVEAGMKAIIGAFILVLLFMGIYYRKFGLVANLALMTNLVMIIGVMSMIPGATLTMPGIAGIVLTVGMAVDANVIIFERIREELVEGRSPQQAIARGYENAFSTIADANITTLITALILFAVGTGSIKGFAVTLAIGIVTSMFTAIAGTRAVINLTWGRNKRLKELSI
ncbi:protein translocase subunit SecD [Aliidiomarina haloalkalitolerans]|uniref:Protein translocase subunit SecD n=1 Tax=Aliidiomarina haloalkalitolerans TaxID=859059 RepID=A0A432VTT8_9GAMM|nr:protein translocase subunit SecD [Aliidiomarina haloalkalitolerans]MCL4409417.1 protein translocase subunit SecD [Gammaproteobacteria bacterium]RUO19853.1 protein translocase subunit SecD [Aliidiomarina haloalkalitolerans]